MKKLILLFLLCCGQMITAQAYSTDSMALPEIRVRNYIFTTPVSRNTQINGLAVGGAAIGFENETIRVNGVNLEIEPAGALIAVFAIFGTAFSPFDNKDTSYYWFNTFGNYRIYPKYMPCFAHINGCSISAGGQLPATETKGVAINGLVGGATEMHGVELTGIMNDHYVFNGVNCALLRNKSTHGKGLQLALINSCRDGKVVQIGLFNRIGRRVVPFVNFSLRKKPQS